MDDALTYDETEYSIATSSAVLPDWTEDSERQLTALKSIMHGSWKGIKIFYLLRAAFAVIKSVETDWEPFRSSIP